MDKEVRADLEENAERYFRRCWGAARKLLAARGGNTNGLPDIDDLVQEVFVRILEKEAVIEITGSDLFGIMFKILARRIYDETNPGRMNGTIHGVLNGREPDYLEDNLNWLDKGNSGGQETSVFLSEVLTAISHLPKGQIDVIVLAAFGLSASEIACELGQPMPGVRSRLFEARKTLEPLLGRPRLHVVKSGKYPGVTKHGRKYRAAITVEGKRVVIGSFSTPEAASGAFEEARRQRDCK